MTFLGINIHLDNIFFTAFNKKNDGAKDSGASKPGNTRVGGCCCKGDFAYLLPIVINTLMGTFRIFSLKESHISPEGCEILG